MTRLRTFWQASILNRALVLTCVFVFCCCPIGLASGPQSEQTPASQEQPVASDQFATDNSAVLIEATEEAAESPTEAPTPSLTPTDEPTPTTPPEPTAAPTAFSNTITDEDQAYLDALAPQIDSMGESMSAIGELFSMPDIASEEWRFSVGFALGVLAESHNRIAAIAPPARLSDFHMRLTGGTQQCADASSIIAEALDNFDAEGLNEGALLIQGCGNTLTELAPELQRLFAS